MYGCLERPTQTKDPTKRGHESIARDVKIKGVGLGMIEGGGPKDQAESSKKRSVKVQGRKAKDSTA